MGNKWVKIENTGYYVNSNGKIWSPYIKKHLKQTPGNHGYLRVTLNTGRVKKVIHRLVHRIVAEAFIPNLKNKRCINHKNGNKHDNRVSNLEWVTYSENQKHAFANGLNRMPVGNDSYSHKLDSDDVLFIKELWRYSEEEKYLRTGAFPQEFIAACFNVGHTTIGSICNNRNWKHVNNT